MYVNNINVTSIFSSFTSSYLVLLFLIIPIVFLVLIVMVFCNFRLSVNCSSFASCEGNFIILLLFALLNRVL